MKFTLEKISYSYTNESEKVLNNISMIFNSNEIFALAGENGSGKTTLINILMGRLFDYKGLYKIDNQIIEDYTGNFIAKKNIGFSSDTVTLDNSLTGLEILELVSEIRGCELKQFQNESRTIKDYLNIGNWMSTKKCSQYSMGMKKKISIAAAYVGGTKFVILDEPLNGLDPLSIYGLQKYVIMRRKEGVGLLLATHILDFAEKVADTLLLLKNGEILFNGNFKDLKQSHEKSTLNEIYFNLYMKKNSND